MGSAKTSELLSNKPSAATTHMDNTHQILVGLDIINQRLDDLEARITSTTDDLKDKLNQLLNEVRVIAQRKAVVNNTTTQVIPEEKSQVDDLEVQDNILYTLSRDVTTVPELWKEWHLGLHGGPAVVDLNHKDKYWFMHDKTFYSKRERIISAIKAYAEERDIPERTAMRMAEDTRVRKKMDLDKLGHHKTSIF